MMREIVFDTETTGLDPAEGHRLVEFAGIELVERMPTGRKLHFHCNPGRPMPPEAEAVHGLTDAFLADKPRFAEQVDQLLDFLGDGFLVAHNAPFDMRFLNAELDAVRRPRLNPDRVIDTLDLARKRFPGAKHTLDALCQRFGIDRSHRVLHGALIDAELLAEVYVELTGGRQIGLELSLATARPVERHRELRPARTFDVPADELEAHRAFLAQMKDPLWLVHERT